MIQKRDKTGQFMNKEILRQYKSLRMEEEREKRRISAMYEDIMGMNPEWKESMDVVTKGKKGKKPLGLCTIKGCEDNTKINRKRALLRKRKAIQEIRLSEIENMILDVEEYINSVENSEFRILLRMHFIDGKTWEEIAESMGEGYTAEGCKKKIQRFLREN